VSDAAGKLVFHAHVEPTGPWLSGAGARPAVLGAVRSAFSLPILARRGDGAVTRSRFDWEFGDARLRPVAAWLCVDAPFADGLAPGTHHALQGASVEVRGMRWRLGWPRRP
jgi:hypothetical protein